MSSSSCPHGAKPSQLRQLRVGKTRATRQCAAFTHECGLAGQLRTADRVVRPGPEARVSTKPLDGTPVEWPHDSEHTPGHVARLSCVSACDCAKYTWHVLCVNIGRRRAHTARSHVKIVEATDNYRRSRREPGLPPPPQISSRALGASRGSLGCQVGGEEGKIKGGKEILLLDPATHPWCQTFQLCQYQETLTRSQHLAPRL